MSAPFEKDSPKTRQEAYLLNLISDVVTLDNELGKLRQDVLNFHEVIPAVADKEMKRAGAVAIESLAGEVGKIARRVAGDAAAVEKHTAFTKAVLVASASVLACAFLFGGGGFLAAKAAAAIRVDAAQKDLAEANKAVDQAKAELASYQAVADKTAAAEIEKIKTASGWAGTPTGRLAKQFFDVGGGLLAANCKGDTWDIVKNKEVKWCVPKRRDLLGDSVQYGWKIP
jgi:hypothetical protein